ncbi:EcbG [Bibersteinia trehalosi USDA-ARS-USMARC-192]|uniref:phosphotransferase n=1 Tax=Bibersteinia trehalosi TaxID=47735 RepID=UPI0002C0D4A3|nr:phosphotransferase [Bibersteinia trehalosi]AGH37710.1 EcbG [Bibersteinia trehalosi USDA-ARS-USMARC-192]
MILINSAAYVNSEFRNEFGSIPPCFLPIGNRKLLTYQVTSLRKQFGNNTKIVVSLPQKYILNIDEKLLISNLGVTPVFVPEGISLGMAVLYVLNTVEIEGGVLRLLHGDTLLNSFPNEKNCIALVQTQDDYEWEFENNLNKNLVWCGYFSFSSPRKFIRALATTQGNFTESVYAYAKQESSLEYKEVIDWYDLGHINTYFQSRSAITTQRAFNSLKIENGVVWKSGSPPRKIEAEANWFTQLPTGLKRFTPQLIQSGKTVEGFPFYETEYLPILPLNEIFVHGKNPTAYWEKIIGLITHYMSESRKYFNTNDRVELEKIALDSKGLYADKTYERLENYAAQKGINLDNPVKYDGIKLPALREIAQECINETLKLPVIPAIVHGDLCFSNIMYDSRSNGIKVIDPRGLNINQELTIYGNQSYDLAKLCHSFIGLYDFIIADAFELEYSESLGVKLIFNIDERLNEVQKIFMSKKIIPDINNHDIIAPTILLFLSMIPLHFDKPRRQDAMLANALRMYVNWKSLT